MYTPYTTLGQENIYTHLPPTFGNIQIVGANNYCSNQINQSLNIFTSRDWLTDPMLRNASFDKVFDNFMFSCNYQSKFDFIQQNYSLQSFTLPPINLMNIQNPWNNYGNFDTFTPVQAQTPEKTVTGTSVDVIKVQDIKPINTTVSKAKLTTDERFEIYLECILGREGGYSNHKNDSGGATNYGITWKTYDAYRKSKNLPTRSVKEITMEEVREIYYENYYLKSGADKIEDLTLGLYVFDTAVNCGGGTAKKILKKSGNDTKKFEELRIEHYNACVRKRPENNVFLKGWYNRVELVRNYAKENLEVLA